jgi:hypothetical protein
MSGNVWAALGILAVTGAVGGLVNALITGQKSVLPNKAGVASTADKSSSSVLLPGALSTVLAGALAAAVNWGLYGPFSGVYIYGKHGSTKVGVTLVALVTAAVVGFGGARWLTNEVDKVLLRQTAVVAAGKPADQDASTRLMSATPAASLAIANAMQGGQQDGHQQHQGQQADDQQDGHQQHQGQQADDQQDGHQQDEDGQPGP